MHQVLKFLADGQLLIYVADAVSPFIKFLWVPQRASAIELLQVPKIKRTKIKNF